MIAFPRSEIHTEEDALDWWEGKFAAGCEELEVQVSAAALVRSMVASIREIRRASLDATLSLSQAAGESGYSSKQIGRWIRAGKLANVGTAERPRVRRADVLAHKKTLVLPRRPNVRIVESAQDIARSVANSKEVTR